MFRAFSCDRTYSPSPDYSAAPPALVELVGAERSGANRGKYGICKFPLLSKGRFDLRAKFAAHSKMVAFTASQLN